MSQQLLLHRAVSAVQNRHEFHATSDHDGFFKLEFLVTDEAGNETTITILSAAELSIEVAE